MLLTEIEKVLNEQISAEANSKPGSWDAWYDQ